MKEHKNFIIKSAILFVFLIVTEIIVGFVLYFNEKSSLYSIYSETETYHAQNASMDIADEFTAMFTQIKNSSDMALTSGADFKYCGHLKNNIVTLNGADYNIETASDITKRAINESNLNFITMEELIPIGAPCDGKSSFAVFSYSDGDSTRICMMEEDKFFNVFTHKYFDNCAIVLETGRVLLSTGEIKGDITSVLQESKGIALTDKSFSKIVDLNGNPNLVIVTPATYGKTKYYFVGAYDYSGQQAMLGDILVKIIVILAAMGAIFFIAYILAVYFGIFRDDIYKDLRRVNGQCYTLSVKPTGEIVKSNDAYKRRFGAANVFENISFTTVGNEILKTGDSFVSLLPESNGVKKPVSFLTIETHRGYKLLGLPAVKYTNVDSTAETKNINYDSDGVKEEMERRFNKEWEKNDRLLLGVFQIDSIYKLEAMFGKKFCDNVFLSMSEKIKKYFGTVYILSENQIGVLLSAKKDIDNMLVDIKDVVNDLNHPLLVDDNFVNISCRAGIVIVDGSMDPLTFKHAEHCAFATIRRTEMSPDGVKFYVYHESQKKLYSKYMVYDYDIAAMLKSESFEMEYQPQYSLSRKRVVGFEALFRVKKRLQLNVNVYDLIVFAERTGKMILLGDFIFDTGMKFAKSIEGRGVCISLNVSPIQFLQAGFVENVLSYYDKYNLQPGSISIEITESFFMSNIDEVKKKLEILRSRGINAHLDDFGIDYSSLLYLNKLPVSAIKIDRGFIVNIENDKYGYFITEAIINIAKNLNFVSIAEGVETEEQRDILEKIGCDVIQGFLIGKSMPEAKVMEMLDEQDDVGNE